MPPEATDWRLWVLAGTAVVSLLWNFYNTWQAHNHRLATDANRDEIQRLEREHKARAIRLEEFRSVVRDPLRNALSELPSLMKRAAAASQTKKSLDDMAEEISALNRDTISAIGYLSDALEQANQSRFADGDDWLEGVSAIEDAIAEAFNETQNTGKSHIVRLQALESTSKNMGNLKRLVNGKIDAGVEKYASATELKA